MNRVARILALLAMLSGFSACAFIDNEIQLEYQEAAANPAAVPASGTIYLSLLEDHRADKARVGVVRNGYGGETASVLTKDDPAIWVSNTLSGNLQRAGYKVETVNRGFDPKSDEFHLSGNIVKVYSDPQIGFFIGTIKGDVQALMKARYRGREQQKMITGHSETRSMLSTGGDLHKGVLNGAVGDFVRNVMAWLEELKT